MNYQDALFLDTETARAKEAPGKPIEVVELAWTQHLPSVHDSQVFHSKTFRYQPAVGMEFGAIAVHGILPDELAGCRGSACAPSDVPAAQYWIGHNIDFDWRALGSPPGVKRICTLALARWLWPQLDSHTLSACMYFAFGMTAETRERLRNAHSASHDVQFCVDLLEFMLQHPKLASVTTLEQLHSWSEEARVPTMWTFGKFQGQPIGAADRGYAQWYKRLPDGDPYVIVALRRAGLL